MSKQHINYSYVFNIYTNKVVFLLLTYIFVITNVGRKNLSPFNI